MSADFLTLRQAQQEFGYSASFFYKKTASRQIKFYKPFGRLFFDRLELELFFRNAEVKTNSELHQETLDFLTTKKKNPYGYGK